MEEQNNPIGNNKKTILEDQNTLCSCHNNKISLGILIGVLTCLSIFGLMILINHIMYPSSATSAAGLDTNKLAVEVNAVNNILTWGSFIVAVLTIAAAVFGIAGFIQLKSSINHRLAEEKRTATLFRTNVTNRVDTIEGSIKEFKEGIEQFKRITSSQIDETNNSNKEFLDLSNQRINSIEDNHCRFSHRMEAEDRHIVKTIIHILKSVSLIANQIGGEEAKRILSDQLHSIHITTLYRTYPNNDEGTASVIKAKKAALLYLFENGTPEDRSDLEFVSYNDPIEDIRRMAIEVIGAIKSGSQ